jgi:hypothetical protein
MCHCRINQSTNVLHIHWYLYPVQDYPSASAALTTRVGHLCHDQYIRRLSIVSIMLLTLDDVFHESRGQQPHTRTALDLNVITAVK